MRVVRIPESFEIHEITTSSTQADFQRLYDLERPDGTATIEAAKIGDQFFVTTSESPTWTGRFALGEYVYYSAPLFLPLDPADCAPYEDVYVSPPVV